MKDNLLNCLLDLKYRYVSILRTIYNWYKNRHLSYTALSLDDVKSKYKKSDTIFILGSAESINDITDEQWRTVAQHDSFGINKWPMHDFAPTFYYTNYPRNKIHLYCYLNSIKEKIARYHNTIFFVSFNRAVRRGMHPRVFPDFFSKNPLCCFYEAAPPIKLTGNKIFGCDSFELTLHYRGALSLILDLVDKLGYRNIVLLGVDLINAVHFYDSYPEMQWQVETKYAQSIQINRNRKHGTMSDKNGTKVTMDQYIYAVDRYYFKPKNVRLYVGSSASILAEKIPVYDFKN
ncbi:MAG: hypothetical protein JXD21_04580 [Candidatus Omnitrophica bacterium]|nr:hypothetical protein [Candidatus Omnitrophota bacterium]